MNFSSSISRISILFSLFFLFSIYLHAQGEKIKFGKISLEDLKMTRYDKDSSAEAVILADIGYTHFEYESNNGFTMFFERFLRIKILTKDGYSWATGEIPLYHDANLEESVTELKALTFNLEDKKVIETKMDNGSVFNDKTEHNWITKKYTLSAIKEGSIIDIHYVIKSPFFFNLRSWSFQNGIPERYSEYEVRIPEYFNYKKMVTGFYPFSVNEVSTDLIKKTISEFGSTIGNNAFTKGQPDAYELTYNESIYKLATKDVPAMKSENFTSSMSNYRSRVEFELKSYQFPHSSFHDLTSTWEEIVHKLLINDDFGGQLKKTWLVKEVATQIKAASSNPEERMIMAYDYVRTNMKWDKINSKWPTEEFHKVISEKTGNSADINFSLILLLKELGLNADPVLLSTREHGIIQESSPNRNRLNYVIACADIGGKKYLLDATDIKRPYTVLPFRCLNGKGILAIKDSIQWLDLLTSEKDNTRYFGEFKLTPEGEVDGKLNVIYEGYASCAERTKINDEGSVKYIKNFKEGIKNAIVDSVKIEDKELTSPLNLNYKIQSRELLQNTGNMIYFNALFGMGETTNPLGSLKREYPVDLGCPIKNAYTFVVEIPDGYSVESLPEKSSIALPENGGNFKFNVNLAGNKIVITSIFNITKTFYVMSEYQTLREFYAFVILKQAEKIVLKKT